MTDAANGAEGDGFEEYSVEGDDLLGRIRELIREGNVRRVVIANEDGETIIEIPVTIGVVGAVLLPVWAAIGAAAAMLTRCTIRVERRGGPDDD